LVLQLQQKLFTFHLFNPRWKNSVINNKIKLNI
jgi:hypothetical protein